MKCSLHPAVVGAGTSLVCCFRLIEPLLNQSQSWIYHDSAAPARVILPILMSLAAVWLLFTLLLTIAGRHGRFRVWLWSGLMFFLGSQVLKDAATLAGWPVPHRLSMAMLLGPGVCWVAVLLLWRRSFLPWFARVQHFASSLLAVAGLCSILAAGRLVWFLGDQRPAEVTRPPHRTASAGAVAAHSPRPRVIWIILDELSYQQVYERRFPGLDLPAFDRLASQATVFTDVQPAAAYTEDAVPSLLTGLPVDHIRAGGDGTLRFMHDPDTGQWRPFRPQETIFQDALNQSFHTAIAGWYNPYCRMLPDVLDHCWWVYRQVYRGTMVGNGSILSNTAAPWIHLLDQVRRHGAGEDLADESAASAHLADYRDIVAAGDRFLQDPSIDFLVLHVPVPHPGGIYDRRSGSFTTHRASYIDNLALADIYLAHVRQVLEQRGEWDSSAIVVMGDHSWRTKLIWRETPFWTAEDEAASHGGQFDDRPGYIVKLPHQREAAKIASPFSAVRTRALLKGILDGSIDSVVELEDFASQSRDSEGRPELLTTRAEETGSGSRAR